MPNSNPRIERLKAMLGLEEKRAAVQRQLDALSKQLSDLKERLFDDTPNRPAKASTKAPKRRGRAKRGVLKEQILAALSSAGQAGVRVTELAAALGTKAANIHAWFHSTGKRIPGIAKVSGGHYRLKGGTTAPAKVPAKASTKAKGRRTKGKGAKRGELSSKIVSSLQTAGDKGLTIKELAEKTGAKYRNVSVWFVTTGKKNPKLKKIGPAHYKLAS